MLPHGKYTLAHNCCINQKWIKTFLLLDICYSLYGDKLLEAAKKILFISVTHEITAYQYTATEQVSVTHGITA